MTVKNSQDSSADKLFKCGASRKVYLHAESLHPQSHFFPDSAKSNDRQRFAVEFSAEEVFPVAPLTGADRRRTT